MVAHTYRQAQSLHTSTHATCCGGPCCGGRAQAFLLLIAQMLVPHAHRSAASLGKQPACYVRCMYTQSLVLYCPMQCQVTLSTFHRHHKCWARSVHVEVGLVPHISTLLLYCTVLYCTVMCCEVALRLCKLCLQINVLSIPSTP